MNPTGYLLNEFFESIEYCGLMLTTSEVVELLDKSRTTIFKKLWVREEDGSVTSRMAGSNSIWENNDLYGVGAAVPTYTVGRNFVHIRIVQVDKTVP